MKKKILFNKASLADLLTPLKVCLCIVLIAVIILVGNYISGVSMFKSAPLKIEHRDFAETNNKITGNGEVQVAKQNGMEMYVNTETLNIRIFDVQSGKSFNSLSQASGMDSEAYSPAVVSYLDGKKSLVEWNAYDYCIKNKDFEIFKIKNGVRFKLNFSSGASYIVTDYLPEKISSQRYKSCFTDKLDKLQKDGKISGAQKSEYISVLRLIYKTDNDGVYVFKSANNPLKSIMTKAVRLTELVGYSKDDIVNDNDEFGIKSEISSSVNMTVYIDNYFDNGQLVVNVPVGAASITGRDCVIQNIKLYPAFDSRNSINENGYIFVPDGAGMLIPFNSFNASLPSYKRPVFDSNLYSDYSKKPEYDEDIYMPLFGMYDISSGKSGKGFFAVIESGASNAYINTSLKDISNKENSTSYNSVCASFDTVQYTTVNILGYYAKKTSKYISATKLNDFDITVRYFLFYGNADYSSFANTYKKYLSGGKTNYDNKAKIYVNMLGSLSVKANTLGVSYDKTVTLTDYNEANKIVDELSEKTNAVFCYKWILNGGKYNTVSNSAKHVKNAGNIKNLKNLLAKSKKGNEIFVQSDLMRVYDTSGAFDSSIHSVHGFDDGAFAFSDSRYTDGTLMSGVPYETSYLLRPEYLTCSVNSFLQKSDMYKNLFLTDMGSTYYADYARKKYVSPYAADGEVKKNLKKISKSKNVALDNPNSDRAVYCSYAIGVSRESSEYGRNTITVPFRQLALNGICEYTTLNVNMSENNTDYYLLQAVELGAIPMFTVSANNVYEIMEKGISSYFAVYYPDVSKTAIKLYKEYQKAFNKIKTKDIASHELISDGIFKTCYSNGIDVVTNYHDYEVSTPYGVIGAMSYIILDGE